MNEHILNFLKNPIKYVRNPIQLFVYTYDTLREIKVLYGNRKNKYRCSICGKKNEFLDFGWDLPIFYEKEIIGGGHRLEVLCPNCKSNDRMRWLDYIIDQYTDIYYGQNTILHIAPEQCIERKIRDNHNARYITGDIEVGVADNVVDVENIQFKDRMFDYIIINHVLEHVINEKKAIDELKRCLKQNGKIIFSMPISINEKTFEDPSINTITMREKMYGQEDHVRLYGNDVVDRFKEMGICVEEYCVKKILKPKKIKSMRVMDEDRVYIGTLYSK